LDNAAPFVDSQLDAYSTQAKLCTELPMIAKLYLDGSVTCSIGSTSTVEGDVIFVERTELMRSAISLVDPCTE